MTLLPIVVPPPDDGTPCGAVDPVSGATCTVMVKHDVHKDETPDFTFTWAERAVLVIP